MNKIGQIFLTILGIAVLFFITIQIPLPMSQEQLEFDEAVYTAQRFKNNNNCKDAMEILTTLAEEYPSTSIYLELESDGCYEQLKQNDKMFDSCINSKLTEYMPARAAICSRKLADVGKFEEALSIWDKNIQDKPEEIFPYCQINAYEQWRNKTNMLINSFISKILNMHNADLTEGMKNSSIEYINNKKATKK